MPDATPTPTSATPASPADRSVGRGVLTLRTYADVLIGAASLAGVLAIGWLLWPPGLAVAGGPPEPGEGVRVAKVQAPHTRVNGNPQQGRTRVVAGDVTAVLGPPGGGKDEEADETGADRRMRFLFRGDHAPVAMGEADARRVLVRDRALKDKDFAAALGLSEAEVAALKASRRGDRLTVPEEAARRVADAAARGDRELIAIAVAAAGNAAVDDFRRRSDESLSALREVLTDARLAAADAAAAAPPTGPITSSGTGVDR